MELIGDLAVGGVDPDIAAVQRLLVAGLVEEVGRGDDVPGRGEPVRETDGVPHQAVALVKDDQAGQGAWAFRLREVDRHPRAGAGGIAVIGEVT